MHQHTDRTQQLVHNERHHYVMMVTLFIMLASIYFITYNARFVVNDELQAMDAVTSFGTFGDRYYDESLWYVWDNYGPLGADPAAALPLPESPFEQGIVWFSQPFYWLARAMPDLGMIHTVMLLNIFAGALAGVLMFQLVRLLGYTDRVAVAAALLLGLATALWPYTRTFLREPLVMVCLIFVMYCLERSRYAPRRWLYSGLAVLAMLVAVQIKDTTLFVVLGLPLILLRERDLRSRWVSVLLGLGLAFTVMLAFTDVFSRIITEEVTLVGGFTLQPAFFREAFHTYLFSIGGSIWGVSPVLLLALPGGWLLWQRGQRRYVIFALFSIITFAFAHAALTGVHWFGGSVWPSRFLLPLIPFAVIPALPVLDVVLHRRWSLVAALPVLIVIIYSLWWQITGATISWQAYGAELPARANGLGEWGPGLNNIAYLRPVLLTPLVFDGDWDVAWLRVDVIWWPLTFAVIALLGGVLLLWSRRRANLLPLIAAVGLVAVLGAGIVFALTALDEDPEYLGDRASLRAVVTQLQANERPGDVLLLNTPEYTGFFLNYAKFDELRVASLPLQPGAWPQSQLDAQDLPELLDEQTPPLLTGLADARGRLWLLADTGPLSGEGRLRPIERTLALYTYRVQRVQYTPPDERARLLEFHATIGPDPLQDPSPAVPTAFGFGEQVSLTGLTLPEGDQIQPGDVLPVSLHWRASLPELPQYRVAIFLVNEANTVVAQGEDSALMQGFLSSVDWRNGDQILDNRALRLPADLAPGSYRLWVRLYTFAEGQPLALPVEGGEVFADDLAVPPITITVTD